MGGPAARESVMSIAPYKGGEGKVPGVDKVYKLSSNENRLGASPKAIAAYRAAADDLAVYPDGASADLRAAIAAKHGLDAERIVCTAGSDEFISLIAQAYLEPGDAAVQPEHAFLMYRLAVTATGATMISAPERNLTADVDALLQAAAGSNVKMVFLANPNNPTGTKLSKAEIARLHAGIRDDQFLILDGAYAEFIAGAEDDGAMDLARAHDNVIVTRTFSKAYGLAALRVGWAYLPANAADAIHRIRGPFNVNLPGQRAALAALEDDDFVTETIRHTETERARLAAALKDLGFGVTPSWGNFLLVEFGVDGPKSAAKADAFLKARGLILRPVANYGLPGHLRLTVGETDANDRVIAALTTFVGSARG